jgi:two-component system cell cycle sensor histidine kinase/response regulator CckA
VKDVARGRDKVKSPKKKNSRHDPAVVDAQAARDAVRSSQRIASQLHQLIAASITVAGMRNEKDILKSLASSTRRVFDADAAVLSLESGPEAPLRGLAQRGSPVVCLGPDDFAAMDEIPVSRITFVPWTDRNWLVAPVLERRDQARGVLAIRKADGEFLAEDREVLTLMAQMAATALGATELSREIEASETRLRILVDTAPAGIVEVDLKGRVRWWNRAASKILDWPRYDSTSWIEPRFPDGASAELAALWSEVLDGVAASGRDLTDVEIKGRRRDLTTSAALLPSPEGQATSILMLVDDVTDHRELKAEIHHAQQMEVRGRVASSVAHDFNNLLTLISGYAEILSKDLSGDNRSVEMVKDIQATASRASMLTAQLQAIGRTQSLETVVLNPVAVLQSNAEVFDRIVGADIDSRWSLDANAGNIRVDAAQFEQMMLNLAINARDAMPAGGVLRVSVDAVTFDDEHAIELGLDPGNYVAIVVADSGVGMDEETRRHCFDTFFTTKGPFKGTGLGLAAARRLVEGSAGAITCESASGVGTTFKIFFPASHEVIAEESTTLRDERPRGSATVLVADDDDDLRRLMVQVLSRNGYEVLVAESGERALDVVRDFDGAIDLLVSDVEMFELTGPELAGSLQRAHPSLMVLLTSGTAEPTVLQDLLPGTSAFLPKPFRPSALIDQVHDLLSRR